MTALPTVITTGQALHMASSAICPLPNKSAQTEIALCRVQHPQEVLHPNAHEEGGLAFSNKELLASQRGWATSFPPSAPAMRQLQLLTQTPSICTCHALRRSWLLYNHPCSSLLNAFAGALEDNP